MTMGRLVESMADKKGDETYLLFEDERVTFGEIDRRTNQVANVLLDWGVKPGDKVCLMMNNAPEYLYLWYALAKIGAVMAPINVHLRGDVLAHILHHCDAGMYIAHPDLLDPYYRVADQAPNISKVAVWGPETPDAMNLTEAFEQASSERSFSLCEDPGALAGLLYTSGTTGPSKGVMLSQSTYLNTGEAFNEQIETHPDSKRPNLKNWDGVDPTPHG